MTFPTRILAVIPARGGSKRLPRKNIRNIAGKPLLAWTIEAALACKSLLYGIVLSTDDEEIAALGREYGADVPFLRPAELASDNAASLAVVQHAVQYIENRDGVPMNWVLLLQPTSPLRQTADIEKTIGIAQRNNCDSVVSVSEIPVQPEYIKTTDTQGFLQPSMPDRHGQRVCRYNGALYLTQRNIIMEKNSLYGMRIRPYLMPPERSVDIDTELDFQLAELLLNEGIEH